MNALNITFKSITVEQAMEIGVLKIERQLSNAKIGSMYGVSADTVAKAIKYHAAKMEEIYQAELEAKKAAEAPNKTVSEMVEDFNNAQPKKRVHKPTKEAIAIFKQASDKASFIAQFVANGKREDYAKVIYNLCVKFKEQISLNLI